MPVNRCPHCGLVNPAKTMTCDCGYSFVDGAPPRFSHDKPKRGGSSAASVFATRVAIRIAIAMLFFGFAFAIRTCS